MLTPPPAASAASSLPGCGAVPERRVPGVVVRIPVTTTETRPRTALPQQPPRYSPRGPLTLPGMEGMCEGGTRCVIVGYTPGVGRREPYYLRTAPPSYSESELRQQNISASLMPILWSRHPQVSTCPSCGFRGLSEVDLHCSKNTHLAALGLCLCGCWPFCLLPYVAPSCKAASHYCRRCRYLLGVFDPWVNQGW